MTDKKKINNNDLNVLLLQFLVIAMLITRLLNIIVPDENLFYMQEFSDIFTLTMLSVLFLYGLNKKIISQITILHFIVCALVGLHLKFFLLEESLVKWFSVTLLLLACFIFFIQNFIVRKFLKFFWLFVIVNSLIILWLFVDVETFTVAKTHFSFKYIFEFVRLKQLFAEAAFNIGTTSKTLFLSLIYLLLLPFLSFFISARTEIDKINSKRFFLLIAALVLVSFVHYFGFDYCCSRVKLSNYLPLRLNLGILPIPDHPIFKSNEKLKTVLEKRYYIDNSCAYSEPKIEKAKDFKDLNIVFIAIESLRFDTFHKYMPELKKLSQKGIQTLDNYSLSNITMSSFYSLFHSNYPVNLAFTMKADRKSSFEKFLEQTYYKTYFVKTAPAESFKSQNPIALKLAHNHESAPKVLAKTLSILKNNERCCVLSYIFNTHFNYYYPQAFEAKLPVMSEIENPLFLEPTNENIIKVRNRYANAATYVDYCLGDFFSEVFRQGINKNTIFIIFGDHGESLGEAGFFAHATGPHKVQFRVPLIILGGPVEPTVIDWPTSHIDVLPTLSSYLNFKITNHHGVSLLKAKNYPMLNLDEAVSGRIIVRRKNTMSLFDVNHDMGLKWLATLNNDYTLTADILKLYKMSGLNDLANRIDTDAKFIVNTINKVNH